LLSRPGAQEHLDAEPALSWHERVPPPGRDATLLAVVPIPGTGTSLAIVGYAIATGDANSGAASGALPERGSAAPDQAAGAEDPGLLLDHLQRRVWAGGREIMLTFQEFELLVFLSAHPGTVFSRADLVELLWHRDPAPDNGHVHQRGRTIHQDSRTVDVHISRVRHKLGRLYGQCLVTEYRVGYQFRPLAR
jgi:DNA-binding winged helix-turn-helix (wHTH) protein